MCISRLDCLHGVDWKPLQTAFYSLLLLAEFSPISFSQIPASSNMIGRNKHATKEDERPVLPDLSLSAIRH